MKLHIFNKILYISSNIGITNVNVMNSQKRKEKRNKLNISFHNVSLNLHKSINLKYTLATV